VATKRRAVLYVRISVDRDDETSTASQERICHDYAKSKGWTVVDVETDRGRSAFKDGGNGKRPGLDRAMAMLDEGAADVLIVWKLDRWVRSVAQFGKLWPRIEAAGAEFVSVSDQFDTTTSMGRAMLQIAVVMAELESSIKSDRILAWHDERRNRGTAPTGPRPFGYRRENGTLTIDDTEATVIRDAAARVIAGDSLTSIVRDLNDSGARSSTGKAWSRRSIAHILTSATTAGLIHISGEYLPGKWQPVLERPTWEEVGRILGDPARRNGTSNRRRHLLAGLGTCARCSIPLSSKPHLAGTRYICRGCGLGGPTEAIDQAVSDAVLGLIDPKAWRKLRAAGRAPGVDVAALETELAELADLYAAGGMTLDEWKRMRSGITDRVTASKAERVELPDVDDLRTAWDDLDVTARQLVISAVTEAVTLGPVTAPTQRFDTDRISIEWRDGLAPRTTAT
jgi:DNA invertase Pin-like site-specific DNA recombinase